MRHVWLALLAIPFLVGPADAQTKATPTNNPQRTAGVIYAEPENPAHAPIRERLRASRLLERVRELLAVFRMPKPVALRLAGCRGVANAWYEPEELTITVCYEYVAELIADAPLESLPAVQVSREDSIVGPILEVFLHEAGHAVFDLFRVPILGREEDAADQFAAFVMLQLADDVARRMILGVAYMYVTDGKKPTLGTARFADEHSVPEQRFYNLMCMAYGAKPELFADAVEKKYLTADRAVGCAQEYQQIAFALTQLLGQHIDKAEAEKLKARGKKWKPLAQR
jgi:hypothetical protein